MRVIAVNSYSNKDERSNISNKTIHLKEQTKPKASRRKKIIKIRAENKQNKNGNIILKNQCNPNWYFGKIYKSDKLCLE